MHYGPLRRIVLALMISEYGAAPGFGALGAYVLAKFALLFQALLLGAISVLQYLLFAVVGRGIAPDALKAVKGAYQMAPAGSMAVHEEL